MTKTIKLLAFLSLISLVFIGCDSTGKLCGRTVRGLRLCVSTNTLSLHVNAPILIEFAFSNNSKHSISFWQSGFFPNTLIDLSDPRRKPVKLTPEGVRLRKTFSPGGERDQNFSVTLKPGQRYRIETFDLRRMFEMKADNAYFLTITYEERQQDGWQGRITSNEIRFKVESSGQ